MKNIIFSVIIKDNLKFVNKFNFLLNLIFAKIKYYFSSMYGDRYKKVITHIAANNMEEAITKLHEIYDVNRGIIEPCFIVKIKDPTRDLSLPGVTFRMPGAGMGVIGAAVASAVAFTVGGICITVALWRHPVISPKGQRLKPDMEVLRPLLDYFSAKTKDARWF